MRHASETAVVTLMAALLTAAIGMPVIRAPGERLFGKPLVGHHHDPFTFMQQIERPLVAGVYLQPATDVPAAIAARVAGAVAAYNAIVLVTFPLSAAAAYLLARHLGIAGIWAAGAAVAFAFSPFHLAHAAYHPHIAQVQWIPLYLLALWRCVDRPTRGAVVLLAAAAAGVTLSNFYGALIAALITPAALAVYWWSARGRGDVHLRSLAITTGCLAACASLAIAYAALATGNGPRGAAAFATPAIDLVRYSARWWSYLMPPVVHPLAGSAIERTWHAAGVDIGLLEQQVSLGWGAVALACVAGAARVHRRAVVTLGVVALVAFVMSLAGGPSSFLHATAPMFRSYARFGVVVQLMTVMLAAIGAQWLWQRRTIASRALCGGLIAMAAAEYAVWPEAMSRPVVPTRAHQWVRENPEAARVLDCVPATENTDAVRWATTYRVTPYVEPFRDCTEPDLGPKLAAAGYSHLLLRKDTPEGQWLGARRPPEGLVIAAHFPESDVYTVAALVPPVHTVAMHGFHAREHDAAWTWRWMEDAASWTISNRAGADVLASLELEVMAFAGARQLLLDLDGVHLQSVRVGSARMTARLGPMVLTPGEHTLTFRAGAAPPVYARTADAAERRPLSFRFGNWRWHAEGTR